MTDTPTVTDMMVAYSEDAVDHARTSSGVVLDYTPESVERVETILREMYSGIPKGFFARIFKRGPTQEMIWSMCKHTMLMTHHAYPGSWWLCKLFSSNEKSLHNSNKITVISRGNITGVTDSVKLVIKLRASLPM